MRPIDGNELRNRIQRRRDLAALNEDEEIVRAIDSILVLLSTSVTLDYVPVIHAQWEYCCHFRHTDYYRCSHCGRTYEIHDNTKYCQHCGAKMDKESTSADMADMFDEY